MSQNGISLDQALALRQGTDDPIVNVDEPLMKLVIFTLEGQWFAFPASKVKEILSDRTVFFLPGCPPSLEGVINVRGDIESVISLRTVLGYHEQATHSSSNILLGQTGSLRSGIRVDRVEDVFDVLPGSIQDPPHAVSDTLRPLVSGVISFRGHLVTVLDLERFFTDYSIGLR